jgi:hypothetical protein
VKNCAFTGYLGENGEYFTAGTKGTIHLPISMSHHESGILLNTSCVLRQCESALPESRLVITLFGIELDASLECLSSIHSAT